MDSLIKLAPDEILRCLAAVPVNVQRTITVHRGLYGDRIAVQNTQTDISWYVMYITKAIQACYKTNAFRENMSC